MGKRNDINTNSGASAKKENGNAEVAAKLRMYRAKFNESQAEVAEMLGISQQAYSNYERGDTAIDSKTIKKLCEHYGLSADELLGINSKAAKAKRNNKPVFDNDPQAFYALVDDADQDDKKAKTDRTVFDAETLQKLIDMLTSMKKNSGEDGND